jgi:hypothetical protein
MRQIEEDRQVGGEWLQSYKEDGKQVITRLGRLFGGVNQRARAGGSYQRKFPHYIGVMVSEEFQDFQQFSNWCVKQIGWGLGYDLDKDLLNPDPQHRLYSPAHCVFLPRKINKGICHRCSETMPYLPGVWPFPKGGKWYAKVSVDGRQVIVGTYSTEAGAHEAYVAAKEAQIKNLANQYRSTIDPRAYESLMSWRVTKNNS